MAQSSSAQRDPSMEEILASIRKIIEEGEEPPVRSSRDNFEPAAIGPAANDAAAPVQSSAASTGPGISLETLDALAKEAEAITTDLEVGSTSSEYEPTAEIAPPARDDELVIDDFEIELDEHEIVGDAAAGTALRPAIISDAPRRQVAASFSELTEALAANRRRSLDDIAEDVLRPMLQDWLDNNLPTLVEKLVREEIERVARGS